MVFQLSVLEWTSEHVSGHVTLPTLRTDPQNHTGLTLAARLEETNNLSNCCLQPPCSGTRLPAQSLKHHSGFSHRKIFFMLASRGRQILHDAQWRVPRKRSCPFLVLRQNLCENPYWDKVGHSQGG